MTLNEITSAIRNRVADGLSGNISNQAFSILQLEEEVDLQRSSLINRHVDSGRMINPNYLYQTVDKLKLMCMDMAQNAPCGEGSGEGVPAVKISPISATFDDSAVEYFGLMNKQEKFIVYYDADSIGNHKYRAKTKNRPYIWIDTTLDPDGMMTAYFLNAGRFSNLDFLSIRAIFEHPTRVGTLVDNFGDLEYPAPGHLQNSIIDALTEKYVQYYRKLNIINPPNTQSDPVT